MALFSGKQLRVINYDILHEPLITICEGAVRSGKTVANQWMFLRHIKNFKNRGLKFIITGSTISGVKKNVLDGFSEIFGIDTTLNKYNEFELFGNKIACFGTKDADDYKAIKGFTAYGWYGNEVTEHHINSLDQALKRCSGDGARIFWDTNPAGPNHFVKTNYIDKDGLRLENGRLMIKSWHFTLDDNEFLSPEYKERLKATTPTGVWYDRDILGLWVSAQGMIYQDFRYDLHTISLDEIKNISIKDYFYGVDWGYEHNGVIAAYGEDHDGNVYRLEESVHRHQGIDFWKEEAHRMQKKYGKGIFWCDSARPDYLADFRKAGIKAREADKAVVEGISYIASLFKGDRLKIVRELNRNYLDEIFLYRWKETLLKEEPVKENDDSMDSERYALYSRGSKPAKVKAAISLY